MSGVRQGRLAWSFLTLSCVDFCHTRAGLCHATIDAPLAALVLVREAEEGAGKNRRRGWLQGLSQQNPRIEGPQRCLNPV